MLIYFIKKISINYLHASVKKFYKSADFKSSSEMLSYATISSLVLSFNTFEHWFVVQWLRVCLFNQSPILSLFRASHLILFATVSRAFARLATPAPASGYFSKKAFISFSFVSVVKDFVILGISWPRYRSFNVYRSTRNCQFARTQSHTNGVPTGFLEIVIKQRKKS